MSTQARHEVSVDDVPEPSHLIALEARAEAVDAHACVVMAGEGDTKGQSESPGRRPLASVAMLLENGVHRLHPALFDVRSAHAFPGDF